MRPAVPGVYSFSTRTMSPTVFIALDDVTDGALRWSETAGLKLVQRNIDIADESALSWIRSDYGALAGREAA